MRDSVRPEGSALHPHARVVARRWRVPLERLAYLDDPDDIEEVAEIIARRRERTRQRRLRLYWTAFYGGTGVLLVAGLLLNVVLIAVAVLWLMLLAALGLLVLRPAS